MSKLKAHLRRGSHEAEDSPAHEARTEEGAHRLKAILCADGVGYSRLMAQDEAATVQTLKSHRELMDGLVARRGGRVVDAVGDNLLAEFPSVVDAVSCAVETQRALGQRNAGLPESRRLLFRIGIHLGDVLTKSERLYGDGVNIAARLEALAEPGGIAISGTGFDQVRDRFALEFEDLGERRLKNMPHPVRVYRAGVPDPADEAWDPRMIEHPIPGFAGRPSVAVLPLENLSGDLERESFVDGLTEDLITGLSKLRWFSVAARVSSFVYKGKARNAKLIGRELGVQYMVEGSVRIARKKARITVQLIEASTGHHVWGEHYDHELRDTFESDDRIVETMVGGIEPALEKIERERAAHQSLRGLDVWDRTRKGWWHLYEFTAEDNAKARSCFREAIELDPRFSPPFSGLAASYFFAIFHQWDRSPAESISELLRAAEASVALDEADPYAQTLLGLGCTLAGEGDRAIAAGERAVQLSSSLAIAHVALGYALAMSDRPDEGIEQIEKAIELSPQDPLTHMFRGAGAFAHLAAGRYEEAASWAERGLQSGVEHPGMFRILAASYGYLGRLEESQRALAALERTRPKFSVANLGTYLPHPILERFVEGWRKAGWEAEPALPSGEPSKSD